MSIEIFGPTSFAGSAFLSILCRKNGAEDDGVTSVRNEDMIALGVYHADVLRAAPKKRTQLHGLDASTSGRTRCLMRRRGYCCMVTCVGNRGVMWR